MRAVGYFSEQPRAKAGHAAPTLSAQNDAFLAYCESHGYEPAASFLDTGEEEARPGFQQLVRYLDHPEKRFLIVAVIGLERLGGTAVAAARAYFQLQALGARIFSTEDGELTEQHVLNLWRQREPRNSAGEHVRAAMRQRAVHGQALGRPPYGYRVGPERRLEIVDAEATLVRYIFHLSLEEGMGVRRIAKQLNAEQYRTRRGGNWSMVTIRDLLRNRVYVGTYARFGVRVPGSHPAIVSEAEFQTVQRRMAGRRTPSGPRRPAEYLLSGLVECGACGNHMIGVSRRQRWTRGDGEIAQNAYRYYQCESRTNQSVCDYHTQRAADLEKEVVAHLVGESPNAARPIVVSAGNAVAVAAETAASAGRVRGRLRTIDRRLADTLTQALEGRLSPEQLRIAAQDIVEEHRQSEDELASLDERSTAQASDSARRAHQARQRARVRSEWAELHFPARQALLRDLVEKVVVHDDQILTVLRA